MMPSNSTSTIFFYVYVLFSVKDDGHYIGYTDNLKGKLKEYNVGKNFNKTKDY